MASKFPERRDIGATIGNTGLIGQPDFWGVDGEGERVRGGKTVRSIRRVNFNPFDEIHLIQNQIISDPKMTGGKEIVYNGTAYEESINRVLRLEGLQKDANDRMKQKQKEKEIEPDTVDLDNIDEVVQANEVVKEILGIGDTLCGYILIIDALKLTFRKVKLNKRSNCYCNAKK